MKFMKKQKFDERQLWIRGNIFKHMFYTVAALMLIDAMLTGFEIVWVNGYYSNIIILQVAVAIGAIEMIFREVYVYDIKNQKNITLLFGLLSLILLGLNIMEIIKGEKIILNGALTNNGGSLILGLLYFLIALAGLVKFLLDKFKKKD